MAQPTTPTAVALHITGQEPSNEAFERVLYTTELLELILLQLPCVNLFGVQRVCQTLHDTIQGSTKIKQAMFLEAEPERSSKNWNDEAVRVVNPLLESVVFVPAKGLQNANHDDGFCYFGISSFNSRTYKFTETYGERYAHAHRRRIWVSPEASWRRMIIAQPAPILFSTKLNGHFYRSPDQDFNQHIPIRSIATKGWNCTSDLGSILDWMAYVSEVEWS